MSWELDEAHEDFRASCRAFTDREVNDRSCPHSVPGDRGCSLPLAPNRPQWRDGGGVQRHG